ncbi:MAG: ABC transporter permease subunit [Acidobacteriota bacterium]|nr:MAG: ABC transporter permease subunit [Acidobacteriota bacterium]
MLSLLTSDQTRLVLEAALEHATLSLSSVGAAVVVGIPIAWLLSHTRLCDRLGDTILHVLYAFPFVGLLGLAIGAHGKGAAAVNILVGVYALVPVVCCTSRGMRRVDQTTLKACRSMGLSEVRLFFLLKLPQSMPFFLEGLRLALLAALALVALGGFVGVGGLGNLIFTGIVQNRPAHCLAGGTVLCLGALGLNEVLKALRWRFERFEQQPLSESNVLSF